MKGPLACVLRAPNEEAAPWEEKLEVGSVRVVDASVPARAASILSEADCVLVDGGRSDAVSRVTSATRADSAVQGVIVAPPDHRPRIQREILFTPGLGEVWLVSPEEVSATLVSRAADVTGKRRRHRVTRERIAHALASIEPQETRRAVVSDAYLASLLEVAPDPILSIDRDGIILSWNPGAERSIGYTRQEAVGRPLVNLLRSPALERLLAGGRGARGEIRFLRRNAEEGVAECIVAPVNAGGHQVCAVILRDLTDERRSQELLESQAAELEVQATELEAQTRELEEHALRLEIVNRELQQRTLEMERAASARSRFYAAMSHELRTPINAIIGYNSLVLDEIYGPVPDPQREALERAQRAASHLLELVNDVLDLSKIEAGRLDLQLETACVPELLEQLLDTVRSLAENFETRLEIEGSGSHCIVTDPRRLRQILLNLISNAIKFSEGKPIVIAWERTPDGGLQVDVVDRGRGIAAEHLEHIFEEFAQVDPTADAGTGLGLPISRRLASLLGGTLSVSSRLGYGSTFRLTLPASMDEPAA